MKTWVLSTLLAFALVTVALLGSARHAARTATPIDLSARPVVPAPSSSAVEFDQKAALPSPAVDPSAHLRAYLLECLMSLPVAYIDRSELPEDRRIRMTTVAEDLARVLVEEEPDPGVEARMGITLAFVGSRETLFSRSPHRLGDEDNGRAKGYWQIHTNGCALTDRGFQCGPWAPPGQPEMAPDARTAVHMLRQEPLISWGINPAVGLARANAYVKAHPYP